jgi:hypothetical protein
MSDEDLKEIFYEYIQFIIHYHDIKDIVITQQRLKFIIQGSLNLNPMMYSQKNIKTMIEKTKIGSSLPHQDYSFNDKNPKKQPILPIDDKYCIFNYHFLYDINCQFPYFDSLITGYVEKVHKQNKNFLYLYHNPYINAAMLDNEIYKIKQKLENIIKNKYFIDIIAIIISDYYLYYNDYKTTIPYIQEKIYPDNKNIKKIIEKAIQQKIIQTDNFQFMHFNPKIFQALKKIAHQSLFYLVNYVNYIHKAKYKQINPKFFPYTYTNLN